MCVARSDRPNAARGAPEAARNFAEIYRWAVNLIDFEEEGESNFAKVGFVCVCVCVCLCVWGVKSDRVIGGAP